jgi:hypothetical protein
LYEMVLGQPPERFYERGNRDDIARWANELPDSVSEPFRDVIRAIMHPVPARRVRLRALLEMTWVKIGIPRPLSEARGLLEAMRSDGPKLNDRMVPRPSLRDDGTEKPIARVIVAPPGEYPKIGQRAPMPVLAKSLTRTGGRRSGPLKMPKRAVPISK